MLNGNIPDRPSGPDPQPSLDAAEVGSPGSRQDDRGPGAQLPAVDIVVGVYNQPHFVDACIESLLRYTDKPEWTLYLVDDHSNAFTASRLDAWQARSNRIRLLRNETNLGFIGTYNRGLRAGSAKYVVLLNSDTVLTPGWLARMVQAAEADPRVALVNPLTNQASNLSLDMAPGTSAFAMGEILPERMADWTFETITAVGFCLMVRRTALEQHGYLDEAFGRGYGEESDLHMRLIAQNWRAIATPSAYIYHRGEGSFPTAETVSRRSENLVFFFQRWGDAYRKEVSRCRIMESMARVGRHFAVPNSHGYLRVLWAGLVDGFRALVSGHPFRAIYHFRLQMDPARYRRRYPTRSYLDQQAGRRKPSVLFVLPHLTDQPEVAQVLEVAHWLNIRGIEARVAAVHPSPPLAMQEVCLEPVRFLGPADFLAQAPVADVAIATDQSVRPVVESLSARQRVGTSLRWKPYLDLGDAPTHQVSGDDGRELHIRYSVDTDLFYPAETPQDTRRLLIRTRLCRSHLGRARRVVTEIRRRISALQTSLLIATDTEVRNISGPWDNVIPVHDRPGWASAYRKGDVLLWLDETPSVAAVLEVLSSGLACVCPVSSDPASGAIKSEAVLSVEGGDEASLSQATTQLLIDDSRLKEVRRLARRLAEGHSLRDVVQEWERALRTASHVSRYPGDALSSLGHLESRSS